MCEKEFGQKIKKITELEDGGIILEITTRSEPELTAWVRSFGEEAAFIKV